MNNVAMDISLLKPIPPDAEFPDFIFNTIFPSLKDVFSWKKLVVAGMVRIMIKRGYFDRPGRYRIVSKRKGILYAFKLIKYNL